MDSKWWARRTTSLGKPSVSSLGLDIHTVPPPVEAPALPVVIAGGVLIFLWALPILSRGIKTQMQLDSRIATQLFLGVVYAITIFIITYGFGLI